MLYVDKTGHEPSEFTEWKEGMAETLEDYYEREKGSVIWDLLPSGAIFTEPDPESITPYSKHQLKTYLTSEQGYICAYCGRRIHPDPNTIIEHLKPKETNKRLTYDFSNLVASCVGASKSIIHIVKEGETRKEIEAHYQVDTAHLAFIHEEYISLDQSSRIKKRYPGSYANVELDEFLAGARVLIYLQQSKTEQHCDTRKGNKEIKIFPTQENCSSLFRYHEQGLGMSENYGKIIVDRRESPELIETVATLGLNDNRSLIRDRGRIIEKAQYIREQAVLAYPDVEDLSKFLQNAINDAKALDENGQHDPFFFITTSVLAAV